MDGVELVKLFEQIERGEARPETVPEELIAAGLVRQETPADAHSDAELARLKDRVARLTQSLRERREASRGLSDPGIVVSELAVLELELRQARSRLLDAAAAAHERASDGLAEPGRRLSYQGRELLDELRARAWRLQGRDWREVQQELEALRSALRLRADAGRDMLAKLEQICPEAPSIDRRTAALVLGLPGAFPDELLARARSFAERRATLATEFVAVPVDVACLLVLHRYGKEIAALGTQKDPLAMLRRALLDEQPSLAPGSAERELERRSRELAGAGAGLDPSPHDLLLAAANLSAERLFDRRFCQDALVARCSSPQEAAAVAAILLLGPDPIPVQIARCVALDEALRELAGSPLPLPAALLCLIEGPPAEVLDNLRLASAEIERAGLGISAAETITQAVRLLLTVGTQAVRGALVPETRGITAQTAGIGLTVGISLIMAPVMQSMVVQAAVYRELQSGLHRAALRHPAHRTVGFHG